MSQNRPLIIIACVVLAIIGGTLWFLNTKERPPAVTSPVADINVPIGEVIPERKHDPVTASLDSPVGTPRPVAPTPRPANAPMALWERQIDEVLRSNANETQTAQTLINLLPTMPEEGQSEAAQHITNLLTDEEYSRALPLVKNAALSEEVLDVFVTDLMNREDKVKLPAFLDIAKIPNHPHHEEALSDLQIFLDEDFQSDWGKWDQAVKAYLKKQEAEEAGTDEPVAPVPVKPAPMKK